MLRGSAIFDSTPYLNFYTGNTEMADGVVVGKTFTIDVAVKPEKPAGYDTATDRVFSYIVGKGDEQYALQQLKAKNGEETVEFYFYYNNNWPSVSAPMPADWFGKEHRVTVSYNYEEGAAKPITIKLYIDGELMTTYNEAGSIANSSQKFSIGINSQYPNRGTFTGDIDSVRIFKEVLTPQAIDEADMDPGDQYRVFFWADFDDEEGVTPTQVVDKGGYGYNGTLRSGSTIVPKEGQSGGGDGGDGKPGAITGDKALRGTMTLESNDDLDITGTTPITLEAWVKPEALGGHKSIMGKGDNQYMIKTNAKNLEFFIYDESRKNANYDQYVSVAFPLNEADWVGKWRLRRNKSEALSEWRAGCRKGVGRGDDPAWRFQAFCRWYLHAGERPAVQRPDRRRARL